MKFVIDQDDFSKVMVSSTKSLLARANLPILANVLISATEKDIEVLSTDLETATRVRVGCKVEKEGQITVPGRILLEFVTQLPGGQVTVEQLGTEVVLTSGSYSARLPTMPAEDFPAIPQIKAGLEFALERGQLEQSISRVAFSAAQDEGRPILTGILCDVSKGKIGLVATDGYRLSFDQIDIKASGALPNVKLIVPAKAMIEISKIISETSDTSQEDSLGEVKVVVSQELNGATFNFGPARGKTNIEFTTRLIDGEFPNWQKIIPNKFTSRAKVNRQEFIKLVKLASIFARESGNIVRLKLESSGSKKANLSVASQASQVGSSDASFGVDLEGNGGEIAFNFRYLLEVLAALSDDEISLEMNESLNPGRIQSLGKNSPFFHIIMPVRLQS